MTKGELALQNFESGCNCAQAVFLAFAEDAGLARGTAAKLAGPFGGGIGRLREVCGAISGMCMAAGLLLGSEDTADGDAKAAVYDMTRGLVERFREENGAILCRELLEGTGATTGGNPEPRTKEYYERRPCSELVRIAADILEAELNRRTQG